MIAHVLAQVAHDGPVTAAQVAAALALELADVSTALEGLERRRQVRPVRDVATRGLRWECTTAGRLESSGGAQTSMIPRPSVAVQPSLFTMED